MFEFPLSLLSGNIYYLVLKNRAGLVFNLQSSTMEAVNTANWAHYVIMLIEAVAGSGNYFGSAPSGLPQDLYLMPVMAQTGASAASTDRGEGTILALDWSGAGVNTLTLLPQNGVNGPAQIPQVQNDLASAQEILNSLYAAALANPNGIAEIEVDGQRVQYQNARQIQEAIYYWERKVALLSGRRARISNVCLSGF